MQQRLSTWLLVASLVIFAAGWFSGVLPEGPVLWVLSEHHGLVASDLPGLAALIVAAVMVFRRTRR